MPLLLLPMGGVRELLERRAPVVMLSTPPGVKVRLLPFSPVSLQQCDQDATKTQHDGCLVQHRAASGTHINARTPLSPVTSAPLPRLNLHPRAHCCFELYHQPPCCLICCR